MRKEHLPVGRAFAHYRIESVIGAGAMGVVYLGRDTHLCRPVAIKVLASEWLGDSTRERVREEAHALSKLSHPSIAAVFDFGSDGALDYLVMEFVPGTTLDVMLKSTRLNPDRVVHLGSQLARGLAAAHAADVIHRDIKPGNVRVTPEGFLKILDFGVATSGGELSETATTSGRDGMRALAGTVQYMAPERLCGAPADARSDIFSAGAVLYEMACGRPPFADEQPVRMIDAILNHAPVRPRAISPAISGELERIILRALDKNPDRRYPRAADLAEALEAVRLAPAPGLALSLARWIGRGAAVFMTSA